MAGVINTPLSMIRGSGQKEHRCSGPRKPNRCCTPLLQPSPGVVLHKTQAWLSSRRATRKTTLRRHPTYLLAHLRTYRPTYLPTYLPTCPPTYLPTCPPICLPTYLPTYRTKPDHAQRTPLKQHQAFRYSKHHPTPIPINLSPKNRAQL